MALRPDLDAQPHTRRGRYDGDDITKLEQLLGRVQRELGGQVGSFRLKGARHRFTGRSSLVAFADGMHGGEFALKFYCDPEAAQTEFAIYRQATVRAASREPRRQGGAGARPAGFATSCKGQLLVGHAATGSGCGVNFNKGPPSHDPAHDPASTTVRCPQTMHMSLPPVHEIEDNTGGVIRLKDGTPLPPYLAMPRGLPLPEWYATHRPRQVAVLTMLAQVVFRLERLHTSGYCHNDIKPANVVLLDAGVGRPPEWHVVDFTCIAQIGAARTFARARARLDLLGAPRTPLGRPSAFSNGAERRRWRSAGAQTRARYTLEYASPEVIRAVGAMRAHYVACRPSMDIWSLGVIVFEVLTGKAFFPMEYNRDAMKDGLMGVEPLPVEEDPRLFSRIPAEAALRQTVKAMLSRDTEKRPTAATVGRIIREAIREITGEAPTTPQESSPVSTIGRASSVVGGR